MFQSICNIDKSDRINRSVIGVLMVLGALLGAGKSFFILFGIILIIEGIIGWCSIPIIMARIKNLLK